MTSEQYDWANKRIGRKMTPPRTSATGTVIGWVEGSRHNGVRFTLDNGMTVYRRYPKTLVYSGTKP